ncbi:sulfite exporter TauE/SafE family protein [Thioclava sp. FTW29]|uniref:Probable membrane transporter protein n=1 Tax=Thioclava litoralis TaxID=3076557 RepID=A0ABZ1E5C2_9RHOB|nr:sulfite exporter TauE/SafE family protein [Thioclava sp. FTW29]
MLTYLVLALAGLGAGALNAVAGGGTFLSFPALVWAGVPPVMANATATFAALPGYVGSAWAYRGEIAGAGRPSLAALSGTAIAGGLVGAGLLLVTPEALFSGVVPWLLLLATLAFAGGPLLMRGLARRGHSASTPVALAILFGVSAYGGYFNGGLGIMLLAAFGLIGMTDLHRMNGLKNLLSLVLSLVSVVTYSLAGLIAWESLVLVGLCCAIGGYIGAGLARRIGNTVLLRRFIILVGLGMSALFFLKGAA